MTIRADFPASVPATAVILPLPPSRPRRLAEGFVAPVADRAAALFFDEPAPTDPRPLARRRLCVEADGARLRGPLVSTTVPLQGGGRRHVVLLGHRAEALAGHRLVLSLGDIPASVLDPNWLQSPLVDVAALFEGLNDDGRQRLLRLVLTTGASLLGRGVPAGFAPAARRLLALLGVPRLQPLGWCRIGTAARILSYRLPHGFDANRLGTLMTLHGDAMTRLAGDPAIIEPRRDGALLHLSLAGTAPEGTTIVATGASPLVLGLPDAVGPLPAGRWLHARGAATRAWAEARLTAAAATDPLAAAIVRELRHRNTPAPTLAITHLSATPTGVLHAFRLDDPHGLVRELRLLRGATTAALPADEPLAGYTALPRTSAIDDRYRLLLACHSGRIIPVATGTLAALDGAAAPVPPAALAAARLDREPSGRVLRTARFGPTTETPTLSIVCPVGACLDILRTRAALVAAEPDGAAVELVYTATEGNEAAAAEALLAATAAIHDLPHRLLVTTADLDAAGRLSAAVAAASAPRLLVFGADVLPVDPGWLAPWRRLSPRHPLLRAVVLDHDGRRDDAPAEALGLFRQTLAEVLAAREPHRHDRPPRGRGCRDPRAPRHAGGAARPRLPPLRRHSTNQFRKVRRRGGAGADPQAILQLWLRPEAAMTSALRILQIAHDHPDWTAGGTEIVAHDLARALDARPGTRARLLVAATALQRPEAAPGTLGAHGNDLVLRTGTYDRFMMARLDGTAWIASVAEALAETRPAIVHLHGIDRIGAEIIPVVRRLAPACRIVMTLHDYQPICANDGLLLTPHEGARCLGATPDGCRRCFPDQSAARHALRRAHLLAVLRGVDRFLAPSGFLRDRFLAWGIEPRRIALLPNAVAVAAPEGVDAPRPRRNRFAFFGNIARHKGPLVLLDAAARLACAGDDVSVTLHGGLGWADEPFRTAFAAGLAAAAPVAQHLGPYLRTEVVGLMRQADWIVVPSLWWENAPLVIEEARAAGRPVICSGIGGMVERVTPPTGLHVPPGDAAALAETMRAATDPALWRRLAAAAAPADHTAFVDAHLALYRALLAPVPA